MNNKGFSLVELLAVIVIIALVSTIAVVSMGGIRNNIDEKIIESNLDLIVASAKTYGEDHMSEIMTGITYKTVSDLKGLTELDTGDEYNTIDLKIYLKNRRASVCISNKEALSSLTSNIDHFSKYFCNFGDTNDDGSVNCQDLQLLFNTISTINPSAADINRGNADLYPDGILSNQDVTLLYRKLLDNGLNCPKPSSVTSGPLKGDVNSDGKLTCDDYILLKRYILGTSGSASVNKANADMNDDNIHNAQDYLMLKRVILSMGTTCYVEKGDVNFNGIVDCNDANLLRQYVLGTNTSSVDIDAADYNNDGNINIRDYNKLKQDKNCS